MNEEQVMRIIQEELLLAEGRIRGRLFQETDAASSVCTGAAFVSKPSKPLPDNKNYATALESYQNGGTHSGLAKQLGISINAVKKYHNWLIKYGYLPTEEAELSETEQKVVQFIFEDKLSLAETARLMGCSVSNIVYRRDSAIRKGYTPA